MSQVYKRRVVPAQYSQKWTNDEFAAVERSQSDGPFVPAPVPIPAVTGSRGANAALASLITALAALGLVTDSSTI